MAASTARHETRALLRAHLAAASGYRHLTRHCPICHRLLRLAMEPGTAPRLPYAAQEPRNAPEATGARENPAQAVGEGDGAAPRMPQPPAADTEEGGDEGPSTP